MKKPSISLKKKQKISFESLHKWNVTLAVLHAVQGVAVILLAKAVTFPVSTNYITLDTLSSSAGQPRLVPATQNLFDVNLAYLVVAFFFMSAIAHALVATKLRKSYEKNLKNHINKVRWIEYAFSASTMMIAIAMLSGIYDLSSLLMIFMLTAIMNGTGLLMESWNGKSKKVNWLSFILGSKAGIVPWIVIGIYFWGANVYGSGQIPTFVYFIYGSLFLFFNCFALNMYLQYKRKGKWAEYLYGERVYMILSLVAKSALAWQVFFGTLRP
jgi:hypothetical protein